MGKKIYEKLFEIQKQVKALEPNAQGHGYKYLSQSKLFSVIRPLMDEFGLMLTTEILDAKSERVDYENSRGQQKYEFRVVLKLKYTWVDVKSGEELSHIYFQEAQNGSDKGTGSALTYSKRMYLINMFNISNDGDDLDGKAIEILDNKPASKELITDINFICKKNKIDLSRILKLYKVEKIEELTNHQAEEIITKLKK